MLLLLLRLLHPACWLHTSFCQVAVGRFRELDAQCQIRLTWEGPRQAAPMQKRVLPAALARSAACRDPRAGGGMR